jgi:hypothetical protein
MYFQFSSSALAKNSSFGFSAFACVMAKTKCAICAAGFSFFVQWHTTVWLCVVRDFKAFHCLFIDKFVNIHSLSI